MGGNANPMNLMTPHVANPFHGMDMSVNNPFDANVWTQGFHRMGLGNDFWNRSTPQIYGKNLQIGGQRFNMADPYTLAGLGISLLPGGAVIGAPMMAASAAKQSDAQRSSEANYKANLPIVQGQQNQMNQQMGARGIQGGMAYGAGQAAFQNGLKSIGQNQAMLDQMQQQQYNQAMGQLSQLAATLMGGGF